jgi:hypothetical protein
MDRPTLVVVVELDRPVMHMAPWVQASTAYISEPLEAPEAPVS